MKCIAAVVFLMVGIAGFAHADACSDLIDQAEAGLSMDNVDETARIQLQQLLQTGKSGDASRCEAALTATIPQSSPTEGPSGRGCSKKSPDTV